MHIHQLGFVYIKIYSCTQEFFNQQGHIKRVRIITRNVTTCKNPRQLCRLFLEGGTVLDILVCNARHFCSLGRNGDEGIEAEGLCLLIAIGMYLNEAEFYDAVGRDAQSRRLYVEEDERTR